MAPAAAGNNNNNNWLSFSLSPMEMLVNSHPQTPLSSHPYFLDSYYSPDWNNQKPNNQPEMGGMYTNYMVDQHTLDNNNNNNNHTTLTVPKLEDFFGDNNNNNTASYNSQQTESTTQDSSSQLTHFYDSHPHHNNYFTDLNAMTAFSANSGSEVDDSGSVLGRVTASTQLACAEYVGQSIEPDLVQGYVTTAVSSAVNAVNGGSLSLAVVPQPQAVEKSGNGVGGGGNGVVTVVEGDGGNNNSTVKKISDTFGQRTSIYRGVTRHRWTGRYEAHLWDNSCRREGQARKGRQVYLGGYDKEDKAARAYDLAALKYWGPSATTNFSVSTYAKEIEDMQAATKQEFIASLRRKSSGFSRGASIYRGVTRHHQQGRWQARIGRVAGNKDLYLGTFATEEEAAEAYDIAAIKFRGINAVTNFEMNRYDVDAILNSNLPVGGAAKRLKLATEANNQKPILSLDNQPHSNNTNTINFAAIQPVPQMMPYDTASAFFHQNLLQHLSANGSGHTMTQDGFGSGLVSPMSLMPMTPAEFYIWPNQSY
ncbi:AP2-like ethylene-responsive transcription factor AIL6 [Silene latifolia]|uniref:AP2-like ethylene-responsive transcription factor AIL6 n=1 Tax=Silene latifolia TaxID=37657 RepID=UPI003D76E0BE